MGTSISLKAITTILLSCGISVHISGQNINPDMLPRTSKTEAKTDGKILKMVSEYTGPLIDVNHADVVASKNGAGFEIYKVRGWDYPALCEIYQKAIEVCRTEHVPVMIHVTEVTQPQGHSTSGSHERYKTKARLEWEKEYDCIVQMRKWMIESAIISEEAIEELEATAKDFVRETQREAWNEFLATIKVEKDEVIKMINDIANGNSAVTKITSQLAATPDALRKEVISACRKALRLSASAPSQER